MKTACHRAYLTDVALRSASYGSERGAYDVVRREVGWLLALSSSSGAELHKWKDARLDRTVFAIELDPWQEAAYRGVMP